ncbi:MAG TPA: hypothetical protein VGK74_02425 [Symbiobacteriaceae bacterium]|jgi:hypothetical protein
MNHLLGMLEPQTICEALDKVKVAVTESGIPLSPRTVSLMTLDWLNAAVKAERKAERAAKRKPKEE